MIRQLIQSFILVFVLTTLASAVNVIPNANTTDSQTYDTSNFTDVFYEVNSTDNIGKLILKETINSYPFNQTITLKDTTNNTLVLKFKFTKTSFALLSTIYRNTTVYFRSVPQELTRVQGNGEIYARSMEMRDSLTYLDLPFGDSVTNEVILRDLRYVYVDKNLGVGIENPNIRVDLIDNIYLTHLELSGAQQDNYDILYLLYQDKGMSNIQYGIANDVEKLNIFFYLIFKIGKGLLWLLNTLSFGVVISDIDYYKFQMALLEPLVVLNQFLIYAFGIIRFIFTMGILWTVSIVEMILFIYSYGKNKDITGTVNDFALYSYVFLNYVILKPLLWIFEHLVMGIIKLLSRQ